MAVRCPHCVGGQIVTSANDDGSITVACLQCGREVAGTTPGELMAEFGVSREQADRAGRLPIAFVWRVDVRAE